MSRRRAFPPPLAFQSFQLIAASQRHDALSDCGSGVVLMGARAINPGRIYRSTNYGASWSLVQTLTGTMPDILAMANDGAGRCYALTQNGDLWASPDNGISWSSLGNVATPSPPETVAHSYGLVVTATGAVLVCDTQNTGE